MYFTLLEQQRRLDMEEIHAVAVQALLTPGTDSFPGVLAASSDDDFSSDWRTQLARRKAESINGLAQRAESYAVGTISSGSRLLHIAPDAATSAEIIQRFRTQLDDEYAAVADEIGASLQMLGEGKLPPAALENYLLKLRQNADFWQEELEATFADWSKAADSLQAAKWMSAEIWDVIEQDMDNFLCGAFSNSMRKNPTFNELWAQLGERTDDEAILVEVCGRLLVIDMQQAAHGFQFPPRRELCRRAFAMADAGGYLSAVAEYLLHSSEFRAFAQLRVGSQFALADAMSNHKPGAAELKRSFGEFLLDLAATTSLDGLAAVEAGLLCDRPSQDGRGGWAQLAASAFQYDCGTSQCTPLQQAAAYRHVWLVQRLIASGADPLDRACNGVSPLAAARLEEWDPRARAILGLLEGGTSSSLNVDEWNKHTPPEGRFDSASRGELAGSTRLLGRTQEKRRMSRTQSFPDRVAMLSARTWQEKSIGKMARVGSHSVIPVSECSLKIDSLSKLEEIPASPLKPSNPGWFWGAVFGLLANY
jgi:hypothetical protein